MTNHYLSWVGPMSVGATLMYLLDPAAGRRRRALLRDQVAHAASRGSEWCQAAGRDLANRSQGVRARLRRDSGEPVDDVTLEARIRSALGRASSHAGAIGVASHDGTVELTGPVLAHEHDDVVRTTSRVPGVADVIDHLAPHEDAGSVPGLQGEGSLPSSSGALSPTAQLASIAGAAALIAYGMQQRSLAGGLAAATGAGLLARSFWHGRPLPIDDIFNANREDSRTNFDIGAAQRGLLGS